MSGDRSGDRSTPRFEVVASTRRSWTRDQKLAIVAKIRDATLSDVARRHGIHTSLLFRWRRDLEPAPSRAIGTHEFKAGPPSAPSPVPGFVPVMLPPTLPSPSPSPAVVPPPASKSGVIEIELAGGRTMRIGADVDTAALASIIAALEGKR